MGWLKGVAGVDGVKGVDIVTGGAAIGAGESPIDDALAFARPVDCLIVRRKGVGVAPPAGRHVQA